MRLKLSRFRRNFNKDLPIEFTEQNLSSFGGLELFSRYLRRVELSRRVGKACRGKGIRSDYGSNLNVVSGLNSRSDVSVGMNPSAGPRTRLERAGPRSGPAPSQTRRSGCRVPWHTPSVSTRGVGSARTTRRCGFSPPATLREASSKNDALTSPGRRFHDPTQPSAPPFSLTYGEPLATCPISDRGFRCAVRAETRRRYTAWSTSRARGKRKAPRKPPWGKDPFT